MGVLYASVVTYHKSAAGRTQADWDNAYDANECDSLQSGYQEYLGNWINAPYAPWELQRGIISLAIPLEIGNVYSAYIRSLGILCTPAGPTSGYLLDANGINKLQKSAYGSLLNLDLETYQIGSYYIPLGYHPSDVYWFGQLNNKGCTLIQQEAGNTIQIGLYSPDQPELNPPEWTAGWKRGYLRQGAGHDPTELHYNEFSGGFIWAEGTKLAYLDVNRTKRTQEGTLTGASGDPGYKWVDGTYQYYTDSSGKERYIEGSLTGLSGKIPSQLSINTKSPMYGTHYCYIDSSGNERCFEGTAS